MLAYGTPTDLPELLTLVKARVVAQAALAANLVFVTLLSDDELAKTPPGNTFVTVRLGRFPGIPALVAGGAGTAYAGVLKVQLWHRADTDQHARAADFLLAPTGILSRWLPLLGALQLWSPLRTSDPTQCVLIEPMRNNPGFDFPERKPPGWGRLDSAWDVKFVHRLS